MKSRDAVSRLKRFEVDEKRRKVAEIEAMIGEFNQMAVDLDRQIAIEQERAGVSDTNHYAYPTFAKAAIQRRDNLLASAADLEAKRARRSSMSSPQRCTTASRADGAFRLRLAPSGGMRLGRSCPTGSLRC